MTATELAFPAAPTYAGGSQIIQSPFQFVADADTFLRVTSACSITGVTVAVQGRRLDERGELQVIQETHTPNTNRSVKTQDYALGPGALLNLTLFASAGAPLSGQCYVMAQILRNVGNVAIILGTVLGGYITATQALGFPGSAVVPSLGGEPVLRTIIGTAHSGVTDLTETVPTGARWELLVFAAVLHTSSSGANHVQLTIDDGTNRLITAASSDPPNATGTFRYEWWPGLNSFGTLMVINSGAVAGLPNVVRLTAGSRIKTQRASTFAGDSWDAPVYTVREWLDV